MRQNKHSKPTGLQRAPDYMVIIIILSIWSPKFYLTMHSTHFLYGYIASDHSKGPLR